MKTKLSFFLLLLLTTAMQAQDLLENNPPSLKWYQVNTPDFRVLFPKGFESQAQRMANTLQHLHDAEAKSLGSSPRKISVLLQNQSSVSNGFVSMFPRRSEFFTMAPQDYNFLGTNDWLNLLASHEYRHIVQYQHARRGLNRLIFYAFGNPTFAGMSQAAAPPWFWEGDAVATETAFTPSGRGRIPHFALAFKSNLMEGREFEYHKQHLRSFKHFIPDHYVLGYHMIGYLRKRTNDPDIWGKITARSWSFPLLPLAFSNAIHNKTGLYVTGLYREMARDLKKQWADEINALQLTSFEKVDVQRGKAFTNYLYPQPQEDGSVIALKQGIGDIERFVRLSDSGEEKVFTPGMFNDAGMLSAHSDVVVWNEYGFHPRYRMKNYSQLKLYHIKDKKLRVIGGRKERLGSAALSLDGSKIAAVRSGSDYRNALVVFEFFTGRETFSFNASEGEFFAMPRWSPEGNKVIVLRTTREGKTIAAIDVETSTITDLMPVAHENVGHPVMFDHYLLFNSPISGIDNIYAIDLTDHIRYQITCSKYGAYNPAVTKDGKTLYYNDQSRDGMEVVKTAFNPASWKRFDIRTTASSPIAATLTEQENHHQILDSIPQTINTVRRYSKIAGIINPYSWGFNVSNDLTQLNFGIMSRDLLSTTSISVGYIYDISEKTGLWRGGVSYQGLYPILDVKGEYGERTERRTSFGNKMETRWKETTVEGGFRIPLLLTHSKYIEELSIGSAVGLTKSRDYVNTISREGILLYKGSDRTAIVNDTLRYMYKDDLNNGDLLYNSASLVYSRVLKPSYRDFLYRWGQVFVAEIYHTPFAGDFEGRLWAVRSVLYFPGIGKHHYLFLRGAYQESLQGIETNLYTFRNRIPKPRGYSYPTDGKFMTVSGNYALPLWYPDIRLGPVLNIQRIKATAFVDYGTGTGRQYYYHESKQNIYYGITDANYLSAGVETTFDFNFMRLAQRFELGFRTTYITSNVYNNAGMVFEFLIGNIGF